MEAVMKRSLLLPKIKHRFLGRLDHHTVTKPTDLFRLLTYLGISVHKLEKALENKARLTMLINTPAASSTCHKVMLFLCQKIIGLPTST